MPISETIRTVTTQGNNVLDNTVYCSGDTSLAISVPLFGSGIQSGTLASIIQSGLCALSINNNLPSGMVDVKLGCSSGSALFHLNAGQQLTWWSGNSFTNPIGVASGDITYLSFQNVSGFGTGVSGTYSVNLQALLNN